MNTPDPEPQDDQELSPAEAYAASRRRAKEQATALYGFQQLYDFPLDDFQLAACETLEAGSGVLVAAPTGSGKTIVGEFAVHLALAAAASASTPRRSRRSPTRSTGTWSSATAPPRSACSPATTPSTATHPWW